ncbi:glycosyltransferase family 2 protein [Rodentibacter myodis]|uniref:Glycosyltransferase 2-like domain-containing protein n=1 Tax=Rodentibacter myodis TaxID=1907939 RepID=A0A1V3JRQ4_9PAST|nr:glycosyltransferase [Rodentibacter myodis]OOF59483.1 hypothetical protein BKL49_03275 [Rodentibacter myodis]
MLPRISFIVPVYNVEKYLRECLDSLVCQSVEKEIIIINDGSTDSSGQIAQEYFDRYPFITLIHQHNKGLSAARNIGLKNAKGDYVYFIDSDDYLIERDFSVLIKLADQEQADMFFGGRRHFIEVENRYFDDKILSPRLSYPNMYEILDGVTHLHRMLDYSWEPNVHFGFCRTAFLRQYDIEFPEGLKAEDGLFRLDTLLCKPDVRIIEVNRMFYCYRHRENSIMTTINDTSLCEDLFKVAEMIIEKYPPLLDKYITDQQNALSPNQSLIEKYKQAHIDIVRVYAIHIKVAYEKQYLKYSDELKARVKPLFTSKIINLLATANIDIKL